MTGGTRGRKNRPYISVAFANRNDNYGNDLNARIEKFIEYYAIYVSRWPGLFEFVICDWNPPSDRPRLRDAFDWAPLGDVVHIEVPAPVHQKIAGPRGRKILDYYGRNTAARRGRGEFILVLNQDIFVSESILQILARRTLSKRAFYRADRCDFDFEPCRSLPARMLEAEALRRVFQINRRHTPANDPISIPSQADTIDKDGWRLMSGETYDEATHVVDCAWAVKKLRSDRTIFYLGERKLLAPFARRALAGQSYAEWRKAYLSDFYYTNFFLHTNAAGDFIIAPAAAFRQICGMPETTLFYLHLDSYATMQLFAAGYRQIIFSQPHRVFHADHDRSGRLDFQEEISWAEHERAMSEILRQSKGYLLNGSDWGLAKENLPIHVDSSLE